MESQGRRELQQLTLLCVGVVTLRLALSRAMDAPSIFTDEYAYVEAARSVPQLLSRGQGLCWDLAPTFHPCWIYPLLIAPFINLLTWDSAYSSIRFMNALLMGLTVFPVYGLARELTDRRRALGAAALTALLPAMGYSAMIITESLFMPVFALALLLIWRAVFNPTPWRRLLAGLVCGLAFHVKPHGLLLPVATAATVLIFEADRLRDAPPGGSRVARYIAGVARHWLTALGWAIAFMPRLLAVRYLENPSAPLSVATILGNYSGLAAGERAYGATAILASGFRYTLAWTWCLGILPAYVLIGRLFASLRGRETPPMRLMVILTTVVTAGMLSIVSRHTVTNNPTWNLHERYFFVVLPAALIVFCARAETLRIGQFGRFLWDMLLIAMVFLNAWVAHTVMWSLPSNSPSFTSSLLMMKPDTAGIVAIVAMLVPALLAVGLLMFAELLSARWQGAVVALLLISFNVGWYGYHGRVLSKDRKEEMELARKVDREVGPSDTLLILRDGMDTKGRMSWQVGVRNAGLAVTVDPKQKRWFEVLLRLEKDGSLKAPVPLKRAFLLAANGWKTNRRPVKEFDRFGLYRVDDNPPLRLDPAQAAEYARVGSTTDTLSHGRAFLDGLKLSILERRMPTMYAGERGTMELKVRNDSAFALPGGAIRVALGYHWSDPKRLGHWGSIIWDDDRQTKLEKWLEPGGVCDVKMEVMPPETPGDEYVLIVKPIVLATQGTKKTKNWDTSKDSGFIARLNVLPARVARPESGGTAPDAAKASGAAAGSDAATTTSRQAKDSTAHDR